MAQITLYDEIGGPYGTTAAAFRAQLEEAGPGDLDLSMSSPGGDVFEGISIYNALRSRSGQVRITVDGIAASIASVIAQAASPGQLLLGDGAMVMIHDAFGATIGDAADHRQMADTLDKASDQIAGIYARRSRRPAAEHRTAMRAETWYTAEEAVEAGLADPARWTGTSARYPRRLGLAASAADPWSGFDGGGAFRRALTGEKARGVDARGKPMSADRKRAILAVYDEIHGRHHGRPYTAGRIAASARLDDRSPVVRRIFGP